MSTRKTSDSTVQSANILLNSTEEIQILSWTPHKKAYLQTSPPSSIFYLYFTELDLFWNNT